MQHLQFANHAMLLPHADTDPRASCLALRLRTAISTVVRGARQFEGQ